jgi:hypothetical protein
MRLDDATMVKSERRRERIEGGKGRARLFVFIETV